MNPSNSIAKMNDLLNCPTCERYRKYRRIGQLLQFDGAEPKTRGVWVQCCSCQGLGKIAPDNRSMNATE